MGFDPSEAPVGTAHAELHLRRPTVGRAPRPLEERCRERRIVSMHDLVEMYGDRRADDVVPRPADHLLELR